MIHVDRSSVPRPLALALHSNSPAQQELALARQFFHNVVPGSGRLGRGQQLPFAFRVYWQSEVREALTELFHGKCAYCEARVTAVSVIDVELFRPKSSVTERSDHPGYWWLAMAWENMLASCADCNRIRAHEGIKTGKANRFPLEDESARAFAEGEETKEKPLLLDPCVDQPEEHLVYSDDGIVSSDTVRGQTTIAVLGLNRPGLLEARQRAAHEVLGQFVRLASATIAGEDVQREREAFRRLSDPSEEFAGFKRQLVRARVKEFRVALDSGLSDQLKATPHITKARKQRAKAGSSAYDHEQARYSLDDEEGKAKYRGLRRLIERIVIENVRAIENLDLDLTSTSGRTPWLMLLGENGIGKSTVLQATALALVGAQAFARLVKRDLHPAHFIRYRCRRGSVSVKLSGFPKPHKLVFHPDRVEFTSPTGERSSIQFVGMDTIVEGSGWEPQTLLLGYGATRLLPRGTANEPTSPAGDAFSRVDNLFDPFVPLLDAESWLLHLDEARFDTTAVILKDLLALPSDAKFVRERKDVLAVVHGARVPLRRLSDGNQSVMAMTIDILEVALRLWPNLQEAEGIVLLDEVGAHLHPTWKMRIVESLRKALPAIQFLATTHDPLCLRGLGANEVAVMRREEDSRVVAITNLPSPGDFRVDQLLTSDFFGLNSTMDPAVEAIFDEYYALLALKDPAPEQRARLAEVREQLKDRRHLGSTLREDLMYSAVDRLIAEHKQQPVIALADLKQQAVAEVAKIWNEATPAAKEGEP